MTEKSYSVEYRRSGPAGITELVTRVYNVSTGDTVSFGNDLNVIYAAVLLQRSNAPACLVSVLVSGTGFTSRTVCLPAAASLAGDNIDLFVVGPANASVG